MREVIDEFNSEFESDNEDSVTQSYMKLLVKEDQTDFLDDANSSYIFDMKRVNQHMKGNLVVAPSSFNKDEF